MKDIREVKKVMIGQNAVDGAGVRLVRVFGYHDTKDLDPFLMLDAFDSSNAEDYVKGFPWHPHRGIETITYLVEGDIEHQDSLGHKGSILNGECQWMTAGSGIIHQEMPTPSERMLGVQLWLNLPAKYKMNPPQYRALSKSDIPVIEEGGSKVHIISGTYKGAYGSVDGDFVKALYLDVELEPEAEWEAELPIDDTVFVYILEGEAAFGPKNRIVPEKRAILFEQGSHFQANALHNGVRFLLLSAKPLKEPIAWGGPIVMNTQKELELAFQELDEGTFIKDADL
ncbi:pirin family protein [Clostridium aminobutyricum]|uniref:Pirin family protein n=1 Tax=Clostridium aminobutyricum TaxID=33953 RepID=A0A939IHQ1_CLOAM|nr:pirin family protein [Clostridium aminobutyricum]MBN7771763.1 pirin family protein [Clostridium aminobutyricum]